MSRPSGNYNDLIERKTALTADRQDGLAQYEDIYERIQPGDEEAVKEERRLLRTESESRISETCFDPKIFSDATKETDLDLAMDRRIYEHHKALYRQQKEQHDLPSMDRGSR